MYIYTSPTHPNVIFFVITIIVIIITIIAAAIMCIYIYMYIQLDPYYQYHEKSPMFRPWKFHDQPRAALKQCLSEALEVAEVGKRICVGKPMVFLGK